METTIATLPDFSKMTIAEIACRIDADWRKQKGGISIYAKEQLKAMLWIQQITDKYISDDGYGVVGSFLCNATTWKGETARAIKKELNKRLKA